MKLGRTRRSCLGAAFAIAIISGATEGYGQQDQGAVEGVVKDTTGALIPKAQVTLTNTDQGLVFKATTDSHGVYLFSPIKIGDYQVSATADGSEQRYGRVCMWTCSSASTSTWPSLPVHEQRT